mmetsp:Transcript_388/g.842  ORF Transcript_388/g.842 Transcript_388/m.842 type:complete len:306 (+) Transcript_388:1073-1990(+)
MDNFGGGGYDNRGGIDPYGADDRYGGDDRYYDDRYSDDRYDDRGGAGNFDHRSRLQGLGPPPPRHEERGSPTRFGGGGAFDDVGYGSTRNRSMPQPQASYENNTTTTRSVREFGGASMMMQERNARQQGGGGLYGGGGGGGGNNGLKEILASVGTLALIVAFFASPLGGLFFAVLNSFFVLSLVVPVLLWVAFQGWQFLNTVEGPCPQCGAPVRVLKENETPSICLNCGTFVQATPDKSGVEFYREEDQVIVDEGYTSSIWDSLLSGPMGARSAPTTRSAKERESQFRREATIIDVEVDDKDYKQ